MNKPFRLPYLTSTETTWNTLSKSGRRTRPVLIAAFVTLVAGAGVLGATGLQGSAEPEHAPASQQGTSVPSQSPRSTLPREALAALRGQVDRYGTVRVLVELESDPALRKLDTEAFGQAREGLVGSAARAPLPAAAIAARSAAITRLQDQLINQISPAGIHRVRRFNHAPFLALEVDANALESLATHPDVRSLQEDGLNEPLLNSTTSVIGAPQAWSAGASGSGQAVAILDTGVDSSHGFLAGKVLAEACFSTTSPSIGATALCTHGSVEPGAGAPCSGIGSCDHGTHVAGIAAGTNASSSGVAPDADLIAVQVFTRFDNPDICGSSAPCLRAFDSDILAGLEHVFTLRDDFTIAASNMSLGGANHTRICEISVYETQFSNLRLAGIAPIVASGNGSSAEAISRPGCVANAVTVGATSNSDAVTSWSNTASWLSVLAPGANVRSSVPGGGFSNKSGTSMATPHMAGAIAALRSAAPDASVDALLAALTITGAPVSRNGFTHPRIQLDAALDMLNGDFVPFLATLNANLTQVQTGTFSTIDSTRAYGGRALLSSSSTGDAVRFSPSLPGPGTYRVSIWYPADSTYSQQAAVDIVHADGTSSLTVDQRSGGGTWNTLDEFSFDPLLPAYVEISNAHGGQVVADAVRFEFLGPNPAPPSPEPSTGILIDFGVFSEAPNTDPEASGEPVWNIVEDGNHGPLELVDANGNSSGITLEFTSGLWKTWTTPTPGQAGNTPAGYFPAADDFLFISAGESAAVSFSGLDHPAGYTFELVASRATPGSRISNYTLSGADTPTIVGFDATADGFTAGATLTWDLPGGAGTTTLSAGGSGLGAAYLSALVITPLEDGTPGGPATPAPIMIDFGVFSPPPNTDTDQFVWNIVEDGTQGMFELVNANGTASGIMLEFTSGLWKTWTNPTPGQSGNTPASYFPAADDFLFLSAGESAAVSFSGLNHPYGYRFELVASRATPGSRISNYTLSGASNPTIAGFDATANGFSSGATLTWNLPGGVGATTLSAGGGDLGPAYLNALIITPLTN